MVLQLLSSGSRVGVTPDASLHKVARLAVAQLVQSRRRLASVHFAENLGHVLALLIGELMSEQLEDAEAERPDVNLGVIRAVVQLRRHVLGRAHAGGCALTGRYVCVHSLCQAEVTDLDLAAVAVDEDVLKLDVTVDDGRVEAVHVVKALQDLARPVLDGFNLHLAVCGEVPAMTEVTHWVSTGAKRGSRAV